MAQKKSIRRIFQAAKELDVHHDIILKFLKNKGIEVVSHMSPVDKDTYKMIIKNLAKDSKTYKQLMDEYQDEEQKRKREEDKKDINRMYIDDDKFAYSESSRTYIPRNEIGDDHIYIDGVGWMHEDEIGHDR